MPVSPKHLAEILDVTWHRFVRWRAHLGKLADLKGREVEYSTAEALALMAMFELAEKRGTRPQNLAPLFPALVEKCAPSEWPRLIDKKLLLNEKTGQVRVIGSSKEIEPDEEFWVLPPIPMGPLIARLENWWHRGRMAPCDSSAPGGAEDDRQLLFLDGGTVYASLRPGDTEWTLWYAPLEGDDERCSEMELNRRAFGVLQVAASRLQ